MAFKLFADDIFISYARKDSSKYATGLADELKKHGYSCFSDRLGTEANPNLPATVLSNLGRCSLLVLIVTEWSGTRDSIKEEIVRFKQTGRPIIPIDIDGSYFNAKWYKEIEGIAAEQEENKDALDDGKPSPSVISRIDKAFTYRRRNQRLQLWTVVTAAVLLLLLGVSAWAGQRAVSEVARANEARGAADRAKVEADAARRDADVSKAAAETAKSDATKAREDATRAEGEARDAEKEARKQEEVAKLATKKAAEQTRVAEAASARALKEQERAEAATREAVKQQRVAFTRSLAARSDLAYSPEADRLERNMLYTLESLKRDYSLEAYRNLLAGLRLFPRPSAQPLTHDGAVRQVSYSPDGKLLATRSDDAVWLRDRKSGAQALPPLRHEGKLAQMLFSPKGKFFATAAGGVVRVWDTSTLQERPQQKHEAKVEHLAFSRDESYLAAAGGKTARVWRVAGAGLSEVGCMEHEEVVKEVAFRPDGAQLAVRGGDWLSVWNVTGCPQSSPVAHKTYAANLRSIEYSGDGGHLLALEHSDSDHPQPYVSALKTGDYKPDNGFPLKRAFRLRYSPDGRHVAALTMLNDSSLFEIWAASGGALRKIATHEYEGYAAHDNQLVFSADGRFVAVAGRRTTPRIYRAEDGRLAGYLPLGAVELGGSIDLSPDGSSLAAAVGPEVREVANGSNRLGQPVPGDYAPRATAVSDDGKLATLSGDAVEVRRADGSLVCRASLTKASAQALAFDAGGGQLAVAGRGGVRIYDLTAGGDCAPRGAPLEFDEFITAVALNSGRGLMAAASSEAVVIADLKTGRRTKIPAADSSEVALSPDGKYLAVVDESGDASSNRVKVWDIAAGRVVTGVQHFGDNPDNNPLRVALASELRFGEERLFLLTSNLLDSRMWDITGLPDKPSEVARLTFDDQLELGDGEYLAASWLSPGGRYVAAGANQRAARQGPGAGVLKAKAWLLAWQPGEVARRVCAQLSRNISLTEWADDFQKQEYELTCPQLPRPPR
jgi:WD40 repeat protein